MVLFHKKFNCGINILHYLTREKQTETIQVHRPDKLFHPMAARPKRASARTRSMRREVSRVWRDNFLLTKLQRKLFSSQPRIRRSASRNVLWSAASSCPSVRRISPFATVVSTGLMTDGLSSPALFHSVTKTSPTLVVALTWLVTAINTKSRLAPL